MSARSREDVRPVSCFQGTRKCAVLTGMEGEGNRIYRQASGRIITSLRYILMVKEAVDRRPVRDVAARFLLIS